MKFTASRDAEWGRVLLGVRGGDTLPISPMTFSLSPQQARPLAAELIRAANGGTFAEMASKGAA